ncbi:hypothetical protein [Qipengyuania sp. MTN3-11]|uniref:hypothetical protein n=1 Tax=Qipengyuania sp. MTN3-11 TaxID=3056557 RepID=UPI0036F207E6
MKPLAAWMAAALAMVFAGPEKLAAAEPESELAELQQRDAQLFAIGWRLARANAPFCRETVPALGILLHDAAAYDDPEAVRAAHGLTGDIGVQAVAPDSPADRAGLPLDATLVSVNGVVTADWPRGAPSWERLTLLQDAIDSALMPGAPASVGWIAPDGARRDVAIPAVPVCRSRFEVLTSGQRALAEGSRVIFGRDFPGFGYPEDEFAAAIAHELAHNLLGHRATLDAAGRGRSLIRLTEREADRLMPWLLQNAGYDPGAAVRFMERWGPRHGGGLLRKRTHDGWDERVEFIAAELGEIERVLTQGGTAADWSRHFRRESLAD